jgi:hypothetical protein
LPELLLASKGNLKATLLPADVMCDDQYGDPQQLKFPLVHLNHLHCSL